MKIELFYTPGCDKCADERDSLKAAAAEVIPDILYMLNAYYFWIPALAI